MVCKTAGENDPLQMPCIGRTLFLEQDGGLDADIVSYEEPQTKSVIYQVEQETDEKVFDPYFGFLFKVD
jgi:hypothetical protein